MLNNLKKGNLKASKCTLFITLVDLLFMYKDNIIKELKLKVIKYKSVICLIILNPMHT